MFHRTAAPEITLNFNPSHGDGVSVFVLIRVWHGRVGGNSNLPVFAPWICSFTCRLRLRTRKSVCATGYESCCRETPHSSDWLYFLRAYKTHVLSFFLEYPALHVAFEVVID